MAKKENDEKKYLVYDSENETLELMTEKKANEYLKRICNNVGYAPNDIVELISEREIRVFEIVREIELTPKIETKIDILTDM